MAVNTYYNTPWGDAYTFNELTTLIAKPLARILKSRQCIPDDLLDDAEQSAYILLWTELQADPDFLLHFRRCRGPVGLAVILAIRGQRRAFNQNERSYRERFPLSPRFDHFCDIPGWPFPWNAHSPRERSNTYKRSRPFTNQRLDATRKNIDEALIVDGHKRTWRDIAELRIDLETAIAQIMIGADATQRRRYEVGLECLLFGTPCPVAAEKYHTSPTTVKRYMGQVRDLLRPHFKSYLL